MERVRKQIGLESYLQKEKSGNQAAGKVMHDVPPVVAVLDTGAAPHPDIRDRIVYFKDFVNDRHKMYDDNSHGTHICGILCGSGRLSGGRYRGIAPDAMVAALKVLDKNGEGTAENMLRALDFVLRNKEALHIRIVNISVGIGALKDKNLSDQLQKMTETLWKAGLVVICAAGNKGPADGSISAICGSNQVIAVGCHDGDYFKEDKDRCELHSGRGVRFGVPRKPDIVAPGNRIISCAHLWNVPGKSGLSSYVEKSGTSMATPVVAGCAALLLEKEPWLMPDMVKERILYTASDLGEPWNKQGWGMINAQRLLEN